MPNTSYPIPKKPVKNKRKANFPLGVSLEIEGTVCSWICIFCLLYKSHVKSAEAKLQLMSITKTVLYPVKGLKRKNYSISS